MVNGKGSQHACDGSCKWKRGVSAAIKAGVDSIEHGYLISEEEVQDSRSRHYMVNTFTPCKHTRIKPEV